MVCESAIKNDKENRNWGYEEQVEGSYPGEKMQMARWPTQSSDQIHGWVIIKEARNNTQESYKQLKFIPSM